MVKFLKSNKAVIVLQGRYAGRKAVIVRSFDDGTRDRPYGHCLVAGMKKYPSKVIRKDSAKKTAKKSRVKCFVKLVNYQHLMPTRYTLDVDLKDVVTVDALQTKDKKVAACKATKERFEERFKTGKNRKNEELDYMWDSLCSFMVQLEFSLSVGYFTGDPMTMIWFYTVHVTIELGALARIVFALMMVRFNAAFFVVILVDQELEILVFVGRIPIIVSYF
ncbi:hypothetical protein Goari_014073 [Gossypium aridum]|uniref:60S ribosomal protein L27 n=1 Tax=Gossypium aridum TaxID=34290 RepID=A0A7J8XGP6_GOSAI|nr:hypothetical protein [Gossypium aridum]